MKEKISQIIIPVTLAPKARPSIFQRIRNANKFQQINAIIRNAFTITKTILQSSS